MDSFSITQLAQFSGIKAHTIRMWEQRYQALKPQRTKGNTRHYDGSQLRRLLNIVSLIDIDYKVSELCVMPDQQLFQLVEKVNHSKNEVQEEFLILQMIRSGLTFDETGFEKSFGHCLLRYGIRDTYIKIIYPLLLRIGIMWTANSIPPSQEHFIAHLIRQKLCTAIDALPAATNNTEKWLLFLPENEHHEIGLLFAHYVLKSSGKNVIYLGANMPVQSLKEVIKEIMPAYLLFFLVRQNSEAEMNAFLSGLTRDFKGKEIFLAANPTNAQNIQLLPKLRLLHSVEDLERQVHY